MLLFRRDAFRVCPQERSIPPQGYANNGGVTPAKGSSVKTLPWNSSFSADLISLSSLNPALLKRLARNDFSQLSARRLNSA